MYEEVLDQQTLQILKTLASIDQIKHFYLAGGTALALHLGHRHSIDLDFFNSEEFDPNLIKASLSEVGSVKLLYENHHTVEANLNNIKVSLFYYPYPLHFSTIMFSDINVADLRDIVPMKLSAISQRGSKKDFIDLYFLLKIYPLDELLTFFEKRFEKVEYSKMHLIKSLSYFEDAEAEPMPSMIQTVEWDSIKDAILSEVKKLMI